MKRLTLLTVIGALSAHVAFADSVLTFTDSTPVAKDCSTVPQTATVTLPGGSPVAVTSVGHEMRKQGIQNGYCANVLVSNSADFVKALGQKDATGQAIRDVIATGPKADGSASAGMLFAIRMDIDLFTGAPANTISSHYSDALNQNTAASAAAMTAEAGTGPLNSFLSDASSGGGARFGGGSVILTIIDGASGKVYYEGPNGTLASPISGDSAFVKNMVSIWYGDTTRSEMDSDHKAFETKLLGI